MQLGEEEEEKKSYLHDGIIFQFFTFLFLEYIRFSLSLSLSI